MSACNFTVSRYVVNRTTTDHVVGAIEHVHAIYYKSTAHSTLRTARCNHRCQPHSLYERVSYKTEAILVSRWQVGYVLLRCRWRCCWRRWRCRFNHTKNVWRQLQKQPVYSKKNYSRLTVARRTLNYIQRAGGRTGGCQLFQNETKWNGVRSKRWNGRDVLHGQNA